MVPPPAKPADSGLAGVLSIILGAVVAVAYALLGMWTVMQLVKLDTLILREKGAPQQAAVAAYVAAWIVGSYVCVRAVEKVAAVLRGK